MNRRGLLLGLGGILTAAAAPAIVRAGVLMPVQRRIWIPPAFFVGFDHGGADDSLVYATSRQDSVDELVAHVARAFGVPAQLLQYSRESGKTELIVRLMK